MRRGRCSGGNGSGGNTFAPAALRLLRGARLFLPPARLPICLITAAGVAGAADLRLIEAVRNRDRGAIDKALAAPIDVDAALPDGATALAWAVHLQDRETAQRLLAAGADVNAANDYGDTPLTLACANNGGAPLVGRLLAAGADPNAKRWNGETPLMLAARAGLADAARLLIAQGARLNEIESRRSQNALMWAAAEGRSEVVKILIEAGADVNAASRTGFTALSFAAARNALRAVSGLIAAGADIDAAAADGSLPINIAASYGHTETLKLLLDAGGNFSTADKDGRTPLYAAARRGALESVVMLLDAGADPNRRTAAVENLGSNRNLRRPDGADSPLLTAALGGHLETMRRLAAAGADPKARTQDGATLLMQAVRSARMPVIEYAYSLDDDVAAQTSIGRTVMHASVLLTSFRAEQDEICEIIRFLAERGADPDPEDAGGRTAISIADVWPIEKASKLLYELTAAAGREPKILPTNMQ